MTTAMTPEAALIWKLKSVNAITALVPSTKIFARLAAQGATYPYIVVDKPPGESREQISGGPSDLVKTPLQIHCYTAGDPTGYSKAQQIAGTVVAAINPTGVSGSVIWNSTIIDHCTVGQVFDSSENPKTADEFGYPCASVDATLFWLNCQS